MAEAADQAEAVYATQSEEQFVTIGDE